MYLYDSGIHYLRKAKMNKKALVETVKFVARTVVLVGVPSVLSQVIKDRPQYGVPIGFVLMAVDKYVHKLPNEYVGLVPF